MTTKGRSAPNPKTKSTGTVGDAAENDPKAAPVSDTNQATNEGDTTNQPPASTAGAEAASAPTGATGETAAAVGPPAPPVAEPPKPTEEKPATKPAAKGKRPDPADDPTAGITGVPVTYVPTPAVP